MELLKLFFKNQTELRKHKIIVVANVRNKTHNFKNISLNMANDNEFFSAEEFDEIANALKKLDLFVKVYYNELDFFEEILSQKYKQNEIIVLNFARNGITEGKKTLVPCFCDLTNIKYTGSDAAVQSLCRNKLFWSSVLLAENLPALNSYGLSCNNIDKYIDLLKDDTAYIIKPIAESSSMGVTSKMSKAQVINYLLKNEGKFLVQKFLPGNEYEVPFFELNGQFYAFQPQKINYNGDVLDEKLSVLNDYFYSASDLSAKLNNSMVNSSIEAAKVLGMKKYGRIDFKLDENGQPYIIDIATLPYITDNSSFHHAFQEIGEDYTSVFKALLTTALLSDNQEKN